MSLETGWDYSDHLDELLNPSSKWESTKIIFWTIIFYPFLILIVLPLSFLISGLIGFTSAGDGKKGEKTNG